MSTLKNRSGAAQSVGSGVQAESSKALKVGAVVQVVPCSGTDSGRVGIVCPASDAHFVNRQRPGVPSWRENPYGSMYGEPGRYTDFDPRKEVLVKDVKTGAYFGMFKDRLRVLDGIPAPSGEVEVAAGAKPTGLRSGAAKVALVPMEDTECHTWFERDRSHVELRHRLTEKTLVEWWDEAVSEAVNDGFLDPKDYHASAYDYAASHGLLDSTNLFQGWTVGIAVRRADLYGQFSDEDHVVKEVAVQDFVKVLRERLQEAYPGADLKVELSNETINWPHDQGARTKILGPGERGPRLDGEFNEHLRKVYQEAVEDVGDWGHRVMAMGPGMTREEAAVMGAELGIHPNLAQAIPVALRRVEVLAREAELASEADARKAAERGEDVKLFVEKLAQCKDALVLDGVTVYLGEHYPREGDGLVLATLEGLGSYVVDGEGNIGMGWLHTKDDDSREPSYVVVGRTGNEMTLGREVERALPIDRLNGGYLDFFFLENGNLRVGPSLELLEEGEEWLQKAKKFGTDHVLSDLTEDFRGNGWTIVDDSSLGGGAFTITDDSWTMDDGEFAYYERAWEHEAYVTEDPVKALLHRGWVILKQTKPSDYLGEAEIEAWKARTEADRAKNS